MIPHWQPWLKRFWIVSSPETFSADRLYLVLKHSRLHSLLKFSTHVVALAVGKSHVLGAASMGAHTGVAHVPDTPCIQ